jgi:sec-independent protein translocase protein TatC
MLALLAPMVLLYEIGIWAAQVLVKETKAPEDASQASGP